MSTGWNLTYALLNTIIKYPVSSTQVHPDSGNIREKKMGYFLADEKIFEEITQETKTGNCRHPLTYILELRMIWLIRRQISKMHL